MEELGKPVADARGVLDERNARQATAHQIGDEQRRLLLQRTDLEVEEVAATRLVCTRIVQARETGGVGEGAYGQRAVADRRPEDCRHAPIAESHESRPDVI